MRGHATRGETFGLPDRAGKPHRPFTGVELLASVGVLAPIAVALSILRWRTQAGSPTASSSAIYSIAVLPPDNFSGDPNQEYFADGMTDELTTDLATINREGAERRCGD